MLQKRRYLVVLCRTAPLRCAPVQRYLLRQPYRRKTLRQSKDYLIKGLLVRTSKMELSLSGLQQSNGLSCNFVQISVEGP